MFLYVVIILVLASFVVAFFSAKTWHWGHVVVAELLFLATIGFMILSAEVVNINAVLRKQVKATQSELEKFDAQNVALKEGTTNGAVLGQLSGMDPPVKMPENAESIPSLVDMDRDLLIATRLRGRVWRNAKPAGAINAQTGAVSVALPTPVPAGMKADTVVYLFDDGPAAPPAAAGVAPRGPQYLGEFRVKQVAAQQATLEPVHVLDALEAQRLTTSRGPWIIYESMPIDRHEIFAGKSDDQLKQMLPAKTVGEYLRDGKPATADDDPMCVIGLDENNNPLPPSDIGKAAKKVYQRRLRYYASEFVDKLHRRAVMLADIDAISKDIERLKGAEEVAKTLQVQREDERQKLTKDLAGVNKERAAIDKHLNDVKKQIERAHQLISDLLRHSAQMADEIKSRETQQPGPGNGATPSAQPAGPLALERR